MKKYFLIFATIAVAAVACNKETEIDQPIQKGKRHITVIAETPGTKTVLDNEHNALLWTAGDNFRLMTNTEVESHDAQTLTYAEGGKFDVEVSDDATEAYAYYFAGTYTDANHSTPNAYTAYINPTQEQTKAGVLNGQNLPMAAKGTIKDNTVSLEFHQMAGVLALNIYSTSKVEGEVINSVKVTPTANTKFCGAMYGTDLTSENVVFTDEGSEKYTSVTVELGEAYNYASAKPTDKKMFDGQIYVVLGKQSYSAVKFEIETNKGTYEITSSGASLDLTKNDFYPVNINLAKATFIKPATAYEWNLVTSASQIVAGAEVVIAAKDAAVAMSQTQNTNNRAVAAVAKTGNTITWTEESLVQVFEVVANSDDTYALKCSNGENKGLYIAASETKDKNYLKSQSTVDEKASWTITIGDASAATIVSGVTTNTRNTIRYNGTNNPPIFSCYASGQSDVVFYIKGEVADPDAKAIISNGTIDVAATGAAADYEGAYTLKNIDESTETVTLTASDNIIEPLALDGDVTFSMAPNYTSNKVSGSITLTLASDGNVTATIPVEQKASSLKVSATEIVIPADASSASFTVTSPEFGWNIVADESTNVEFTSSGEASESAIVVTVSSEVVATNEIQTLATLTISRTSNDPQKKTVVVKKSEVANTKAYYEKASTVSEGIFLMVYNGKAASSTGSALVASAVTIEDDVIKSTSTVDQYAIEITSLGEGQYSLKMGDNYIGYKSGTDLKAGSSVSSDSFKWTISIGDDGTAYIVNVATKTRYIGANAQGDSFTQFKAYATSNVATYPKPTLYKYKSE